MNDIYDIKDIVLGFPINIFSSLIFIFLIIILYFIYLYVLKNNEKVDIKEKNIIQKKEKDYNKILKDFEKNSINLLPDIFYSKLLEILREILEKKWYKNISNMTLYEINNMKIDNNLIKLIKNIYYKEYMEKIEDNIKIRKKYINEISGII